MPATTGHFWVPADLEQFSESDGNKYECIDGVLLVTPAPRPVHAVALELLQEALYRVLSSAGQALRVITSTVDMQPTEVDLVEPDLVVLRERARASMRLGAPGCVVLIAEALSPSTAKRDRGIKRRLYQRSEVPEYWILDVDARCIERWTPDDEAPDVRRDQLTWTDPVSGVMLVIDVPDFFATVWAESSEV